MGASIGPSTTITTNLLIHYDAADINSFRGSSTTNIARNTNNFSGTQYASENEWTTNPTALTKIYNSNIQTPVGLGATLIYESGSAGYHHLSKFGGSGETGAYFLSCYVFPITNDITNFSMGLLGDSGNIVTFNLTTNAITYGGGISNRFAFIRPVIGYPGWFRVGANIEGRAGGWVGCVGYAVNSSYTGTNLSKKCFIAGMQQELKIRETNFLSALQTRGSTVALGGGLKNMIVNNYDGEIFNNVYFDTSKYGSLLFDGSADYVKIQAPSFGNTFTISAFIRLTSNNSDTVIYGSDANGADNWFGINTNRLYTFFTEITDVNNSSLTGSTTLQNNIYYHVALTINGSTVKMYLNGVEDATTTVAFTIGAWGSSLDSIGRRGNLAQRYFNGNISVFSVYNRVLSQAEILTIYRNYRTRYL